MRIPAAAFVLLLFSAVAARAEGLRDFCADRPGRATPPCILDAGHTQLEAALADAVFLRSGGAHETLTAYGAAELRHGFTSMLEGEIAWTPLIVDEARGQPRVTGSGDLTFSLRRALTDPAADGPAVSIQALVNAPTATHGLGAGGWTGGLRLPAAVPLSGGVLLGLTPEADVVRNANGHGTHLAWIGVASVGRAFGRTSLGAELWGMADEDPSRRTYQATADLTAALAVGANAQIDAGANFGLNHSTPDVELYVGVARRF